MTKNSDYLFLNLKQLYPTLAKPADLDVEIWEEVLAPHTEAEIRAALKSYRKSAKGKVAPTPDVFKEFLYPYTKTVIEEHLPYSPETYLMERDIKAGRCTHLFRDYAAGVRYVLTVKLKEEIGEEEFNSMSSGMRYRTAVENGLFADFDDVLEIVSKGGF